MSRNTLDLPGMVISARNATSDDALFAAYATQVSTSLDRYNKRHDDAAQKCRNEIRAAITAFGVERNESQFRSALTAIYDRMGQANQDNATRFNFELATALSQLRERESRVQRPIEWIGDKDMRTSTRTRAGKSVIPQTGMSTTAPAGATTKKDSET